MSSLKFNKILSKPVNVLVVFLLKIFNNRKKKNRI